MIGSQLQPSKQQLVDSAMRKSQHWVEKALEGSAARAAASKAAVGYKAGTTTKQQLPSYQGQVLPRELARLVCPVVRHTR